jgi:hypothetical protein
MLIIGGGKGKPAAAPPTKKGTNTDLYSNASLKWYLLPFSSSSAFPSQIFFLVYCLISTLYPHDTPFLPYLGHLALKTYFRHVRFFNFGYLCSLAGRKLNKSHHGARKFTDEDDLVKAANEESDDDDDEDEEDAEV